MKLRALLLAPLFIVSVSLNALAAEYKAGSARDTSGKNKTYSGSTPRASENGGIKYEKKDGTMYNANPSISPSGQGSRDTSNYGTGNSPYTPAVEKLDNDYKEIDKKLQ